MPSLESISRWLHIVVATLAVLSQDYFQGVFKKLDAEHWFLVGPVALAIVGMLTADWLAELAIEKLRWVRRLLSGKDDIEGDWVNIVVDSAQPGMIIAAEYCRFRYTKGRYEASGDTWNLEGKWVSDFVSEASSFNGRELEFYYKQGIDRVGGYGVVRFGPADSLPSTFFCRYIDEQTRTPHITRGRRLSRNLSEVELEARRAAALEFAERFEKEGLLASAAVSKARQAVRDPSLAN